MDSTGNETMCRQCKHANLHVVIKELDKWLNGQIRRLFGRNRNTKKSICCVLRPRNTVLVNSFMKMTVNYVYLAYMVLNALQLRT